MWDGGGPAGAGSAAGVPEGFGGGCFCGTGALEAAGPAGLAVVPVGVLGGAGAGVVFWGGGAAGEAGAGGAYASCTTVSQNSSNV